MERALISVLCFTCTTSPISDNLFVSVTIRRFHSLKPLQKPRVTLHYFSQRDETRDQLLIMVIDALRLVVDAGIQFFTNFVFSSASFAALISPVIFRSRSLTQLFNGNIPCFTRSPKLFLRQIDISRNSLLQKG